MGQSEDQTGHTATHRLPHCWLHSLLGTHASCRRAMLHGENRNGIEIKITITIDAVMQGVKGGKKKEEGEGE